MFRIIKQFGANLVWRDRARRVQILLRFARTEAGGAIDISRAAAGIDIPDLNRHLNNCVLDEERHAEMFRRRAREVFGNPDGRTPLPDSPSGDFAPAGTGNERGTLALTDHGFIPTDSLPALGTMNFIALLYLVECDAARDFEFHYNATKSIDPGTAEVFLQIMRDEQYHVAFSSDQLQRWRDEGQAKEVDKCLRAMKWLRFKARFVQVSQRISDPIGCMFLRVLYLTVFLPFGLLGRMTRRSRGWALKSRPIGKSLKSMRAPA